MRRGVGCTPKTGQLFKVSNRCRCQGERSDTGRGLPRLPRPETGDIQIWAEERSCGYGLINPRFLARSTANHAARTKNAKMSFEFFNTQTNGLWTLPDLWKAPSDLSTRSLENAGGVSHSAHKALLFFLFLGSQKASEPRQRYHLKKADFLSSQWGTPRRNAGRLALSEVERVSQVEAASNRFCNGKCVCQENGLA